MSSIQNWSILPPVPTQQSISNVVPTRLDNLITISKHTIYEMNTIKNRWKKLAVLPILQLHTESHYHIVYHQSTQTLFIFDLINYQTNAILFNLISHTFETMKNDNISNSIIGYKTCTAMINDDLHFIKSVTGGSMHRKLNLLTLESIDFIHQFAATSTDDNGSLLYLPTKQQLILIYGNEGEYGCCEIWTSFCSSISKSGNDTIDIRYVDYNPSRKWNHLPQAGADNLGASFACINTLDDRYIITFGGRVRFGSYFGFESERMNVSSIMVLDVDKMKWGISAMRCPYDGIFKAVLMSDMVRGALLISGFIRMLTGMDVLSVIPNDIILTICKWFPLQSVHLFDTQGNGHWKMEIAEILNEIKW